MDVAPGHPGSDPLPDLILPPPAEGGEWTLDPTRSALAALGDPQHSMATIHVAGTNGKGSVAAMLASVLRRAGHRTGLYTSPHLCAFRERFRIDGEPVSRASITAAAAGAHDAIAAANLTYFEAATVLAFQVFAQEGVEVAVVEVGLGGRLDATNVIDPVLTIVTNVDLDHQDFLGGALEDIAMEKAGVFKPGVRAVTGAEDPRVLDVLRKAATQVGAPLEEVSRSGYAVEEVGGGAVVRLDTAAWGPLSLRVPMAGAHQAHNAAVALRGLERLEGSLRPDRVAVEEGFAGVRWPGRMQVEVVAGTTWVFDVAHNPAAALALEAALDALDPPRPRVAVVGVLADKDWKAMLPPVARAVDAMILTDPPSAPQSRRWDPVEAAADAEAGWAANADGLEVGLRFEEALRRAEAMAQSGTVVVTGSHHTVGDALLVLGLAPCEPG